MTKETVTCSLCSVTEELHWNEALTAKLKETARCFNCNFWEEKIAIRDRPEVVRVAGKHYWANPPTGHSRWNGFGGHRFKIRFNNGRVAETNDLWSQGTIPEHFKEQLPDNAVFSEGMGT